MSYSYTTFAQGRQALALLLSDPNNVFWSDAELGIYLIEALRTWGSLTNYWKDRGVFNTSANTAFYDLPSLALNAGVAIRGYTVTDTQLTQAIQYHLLEPAPGNAWTGSDQFTLADVQQALQRRRDQFLFETGSVISRFTQIGGTTPVSRIALPDTVMQVRRAAWLDLEGRYTTLWRSDEGAATNYYANWTDPTSPPQSYSVAVEPPLVLQFVPPSSDLGTVEVLATRTGTALNPAVGVLMGMPDDLTWGVKFGAMADLLNKDGQARDPARALYCAKRWQESLDAAKSYKAVLQTYINGVPVQSGALAALDAYNPNWQSIPQKPDTPALAGMNLMALGNVPDGSYSITVDMVRNAVVPTSDGSFLQIGREELDAVYGYAQHLACFKMAGHEFEVTQPLVDRFYKLAGTWNRNLIAQVRYDSPNLAKTEESYRPRIMQETS